MYNSAIFIKVGHIYLKKKIILLIQNIFFYYYQD